MADDFSEQLNAVLGNPQAMSQIMSIAQAITGGGDGPPAESPPPQQTGAQTEEPSPDPVDAPDQATVVPTPDLSGVLNMLGGLLGGGQAGTSPQGGSPLSALGNLDPRFLQLGAKLISEYNRPDDRRIALLAALRPFVKEERFAKIDKAIQVARLSRVIRTALRAFQEGGEQDV